jgi:squalene synthase HpnC
VAQLSTTDRTQTTAAPVSRARAAEYCRVLARRHYENFTVASRLLPRDLRPHFYAIYAYCRTADDLADELGSPTESLTALDCWQQELERCYAGKTWHPVFVALADTIESFDIPREPFERLLEAFRHDQFVTRYGTHEEVLAYCRNSADPVGRLVLYLGRCHDEERGKLADSICTGLQLANFCQDVAHDFRRGRIYLPQDTLTSTGCDESELTDRQQTPQAREALRIEVDRAEHYLRAGEPLVALVPRELRVDIALFIAGGLAILNAIRRQDFDVWTSRPRVSRFDQLKLLARCWRRVRSLNRKEARR